MLDEGATMSALKTFHTPCARAALKGLPSSVPRYPPPTTTPQLTPEAHQTVTARATRTTCEMGALCVSAVGRRGGLRAGLAKSCTLKRTPYIFISIYPSIHLSIYHSIV
jgi:hypothetical protein